MIVKLLQNSKSTVEFTSQKMTINAKSLLSILMLSATRNCRITITVEGEDAETTMDQLVNAFDNAFGES
ncbi:MAG TPA: HPr family phosphocarrier protein [Waddliaceae bacterium]